MLPTKASRTLRPITKCLTSSRAHTFDTSSVISHGHHKRAQDQYRRNQTATVAAKPTSSRPDYNKTSHLQSAAPIWSQSRQASRQAARKPVGDGVAGESLAKRSKWYYPTIDDVPDRTWDLFHGYCGIPRDQIMQHWETMREKAFGIFPYPCIGQHRFLNLTLSTHFMYPEVVSRLRDSPHSGPESQSLIDIGCCMGQDIRKLVYDGARPESLTGLDRDSRFVDLSFDLFKDRSTLRANFVTADLMSDMQDSPGNADVEASKLADSINHTGVAPGPNPSYLHPSEESKVKLVALPELYDRYDIVVATSFLHLYNLNEQVALATRLARMMKRRPGSLSLGRQAASAKPGEYGTISENENATRFAHDATTWRALWDRVEVEIAKEESELKKDGRLAQDVKFDGFEVEARIDREELGKNNEGQSWADPNMRRMLFSVRRR